MAKKKKFINVHDEVKKMHVNAYIKRECFYKLYEQRVVETKRTEK